MKHIIYCAIIIGLSVALYSTSKNFPSSTMAYITNDIDRCEMQRNNGCSIQPISTIDGKMFYQVRPIKE